jgi:hypothetical protein
VVIALATAAAALAGCGGDDAATQAASCEPAAFLPVLKEAFDDASVGLAVVAARVERCANGYAQVFAEPDDAACAAGVGGCFETEQVYLEAVAGDWTIVDAGTGISCDDPDAAAALREVCEGLAAE